MLTAGKRFPAEMIYCKLNCLKFSPAKIYPNKFNYLLRDVAGAISKRGF